MKIVEPKVEILTPIDGEEVLKHIELCGRVCYKSEDKITADSSEKFVKNIIRRGHESVLEHYSFSVRFICDRGISHEIVRHRISSISMESTRYVKYDDIEVIKPNGISQSDISQYITYSAWRESVEQAQKSYKSMLDNGIKPQTARAVLPTCLKTELIMTANLREWRHFLKLRADKAAHPDMRILACDLLTQIKNIIPVVFDDIEEAI